MVHPAGHVHHHEEGELSSCEKRRVCQDVSLWPPMDCYRLTLLSEETEIPKKDDFFIQSISSLSEVNVLVSTSSVEASPFLKLPDPLANSDPPGNSLFLRGPPLV